MHKPRSVVGLFQFKLYSEQSQLQLTDEEMELARRSLLSNDQATRRNAGVILVKVRMLNIMSSDCTDKGLDGCLEC